MNNLARLSECEQEQRLLIGMARPARGLRAAPRVSASGFTLVEIVIAVAILLTVAAIAIPNFLAAVDQAKDAKAIADLRTIGNAVLGYQAVNGQCPDTLAQVGYGSNLDPWRNPYQYLNFDDTHGRGAMRKDRFLVPINTYFDLYSMGKDGESVPPLTASKSRDDVVWANDGNFIGVATDY